jgi:hypothetical protein
MPATALKISVLLCMTFLPLRSCDDAAFVVVEIASPLLRAQSAEHAAEWRACAGDA